MKRIIDINEKINEYIEQYIPIGGGDHIFCYPDQIVEMIKNGIPIPDNAIVCDIVPCKDVISRDAILRKQYRIDDSATLSTRDVVNVEDIEDAPPVTVRQNCEHRHENGNCLKVGGFCTSVDDKHCVKGGKE